MPENVSSRVLHGLVISVLPVAGKNRMTSVKTCMLLETAFTALQSMIAGLLISWLSNVKRRAYNRCKPTVFVRV